MSSEARARLSLRRLSELAGISNPYLSQIERGLRKPSAEILQQIAKALRISAETLYVQAGILEPTGGRRRAARDPRRSRTVRGAEAGAAQDLPVVPSRAGRSGTDHQTPPREPGAVPAPRPVELPSRGGRLGRRAFPVGSPAVRRLAVLSFHTSPLAQPGPATAAA